jgi:archaellum component FlaC
MYYIIWKVGSMRMMILMTILLLIMPISLAKTITLVNPETGETKTFYINDTNTTLPNNITIIVKNIVQVQGNKTVIWYDEDLIKAYMALVDELEKNITKLQEELDKKNKQIAELIQLKKTNVELQKNISKLKSEISMLKAENELLKEQNKQYKDLITDLIEKSSNSTKEEAINAYKEWKKDKNNFFWSFIIGVVVCLGLGWILVNAKRRYDYPL